MNAARRKQRYRRSKAKGICVRCHQRRAKRGVVHCRRCSVLHAAYMKTQRSATVCSRCGWRKGQDRWACKPCRDDYNQRKRVMRSISYLTVVCYTCGARRGMRCRKRLKPPPGVCWPDPRYGNEPTTPHRARVERWKDVAAGRARRRR